MADAWHTLQEAVRRFNAEREWDQFHNPKDTLLALVSEVGELADCYRWLNEEELQELHADFNQREKVADEMADILLFLIMLAHSTNIDLMDAAQKKLAKNEKKYPVESSRGIHSNFLKGRKGKKE